MSATLYLEGGARGANSKELQIRCREGFRKLLRKCEYEGRMPHLAACGSRDSTFGDFKIAIAGNTVADYVAMWIDSEDPMVDPDAAWEHLKRRDNWTPPSGATDDQVLFMATCMETWIVADRSALADHYGHKLQTSALPPLVDVESRPRHSIQDALFHATRSCSNAYKKGERSFEILSTLAPGTLATHLPSFVRARRILDEKL